MIVSRWLLIIATICVLFFGCSDSQIQPFLSLPVMEPVPGETQLLHYPGDGSEVQVNPPGFTWTVQTDADQYRFVLFEEDQPQRAYLVRDKLKSSVAVLDAPLAPGRYSWMILYEDSSGTAFGRSRKRTFSLEKGIRHLVMPDISTLKEDLTGKRPRLFLTPERMDDIRIGISEKRILLWEDFLNLLRGALKEPLYPEPAPYKHANETVQEWRRIYAPAKIGSAHMVRLALAYKLMGKRVYLEKAKEWLLHLSSWDPRGIASHDVPQPDGTVGNDEASMPMLERMSIVYDWVGDQLTEKERARVHESIRERGNQVLEVLKKQDFLSNPFSNHEGRVLAFLGLAGLSFLEEIPDAENWLDYVLRCYLSSYPPWGGDDGGWAQGINYWSAYVLWLTEFTDALRTVTEVDIYKKPFFRNTGYFPLYFHPPYAPRGAFGDGSELAPNLPEKLLLQKLAAALEDSTLLWHSNQIPTVTDFPEKRRWNEWFMEDVHSVLHVPPTGMEPQPPTQLPSSRCLKNIGWVSVHSRLGDSENDVWVLFKSSRFGSFSHSHADQNSFQLNAYGEPLLIDSGYYPSYGSPHHNLWTRQTRAHNAILINGRGQPIGTMAARGKIEYFEQIGHVTKVRAEAAEAYNVEPSQWLVEQWEENLDEPFPPTEPEAHIVRRTMAFISSEERPWLVVHDYVRTEVPTIFEYLLHAVKEMDLDEKGGNISLHSGKANLNIYLLSDVGLLFSQTGKFLIPPEERYEGAPEQFHFTAKTREKRDEVKFLALFVPYKKGELPIPVRRLESQEIRGFQIGQEKVIAWWGKGEVGKLSSDSAVEGRLLLESLDDGQRKIVLCE